MKAIHKATTIEDLLDRVSAWCGEENEDWDGHPNSYDIVVLLTANPLENLQTGKFTIDLNYFQMICHIHLDTQCSNIECIL